MAESYSVKAVLSATDHGFSSTLKNAMGAADGLGAKIKSGFNFGILTGMGQQAFSAISSGVKSVIGEIDSSNASWKTFGKNMEIIGKGEKDINSAKKTLQEYAQQTVYSSSDMATTYAQLAAVGVKNTDKLVTGFGGLAAAAENPQQAMKTLSQQATQMAAKPNVAWADFKLMLEQTPAGMAAVAKEMGMTSAELVTAIQAGEIKTNDFFNAIQKVGNSKGFSEMATEAKTMGQAMDGLQETVGNKLVPAWDVLSQAGIKAIDGISGKIAKLDADKIANKVKSVVDTISSGVKIFKTSFAGVGESVGSALGAITEALGITKGEFSKTDALNTFKDVCDSVAGTIKKVAGFLEEHADIIAKVLPWVAGLAIAFAGFKVLNTVAPGLSSFVGGLAMMAAQGLSGLMGKLFGVSSGAKAVGDSSVAAAKSFFLMGAGVLLIAAGFALLTQSAIALASAGWPAIAVMGGLTLAVAGLMIGLMAMLKSVSTSTAKLNSLAVAMLAIGASVLLVGVGFALLTQSSIALAAAGWGAIGVMVGMVAVIALLAVGAAALGTSLTAGAVGFIAFGAAIALVGVGAVLAAAALAIVAAVLPQIVANGLQGALAITALGGGLLVFAAGAALAGAAALVLGAGLLVVSVAILALSAGVVALSVGCIVAAAALAVISLVLPQIAAYGTQGAVAILALGAALTVFAVGAGLAGVAVIALGAGLLVASAGILLCAAGIAVIAAGLLVIGANALIAAASFTIMAAMLPLVTANALKNAASLTVLAGGLTVFGAAALVAGAGALVLGAGLLTASVGGLALAVAITAISAGVMLLSASIAIASASIMLFSVALPQLAAVSKEGASALLILGGALAVFGAGATVAGAGAIVLGAGIAVAAVAIAALAVAVLAMSVATLAASGSIAVLSAALPLLAAVSTKGAAALVLIGAALVTFGVEALAAGAGAGAAALGITGFGAAMLIASASTLIMAAAIKGVSSSMKTIASNAKKAEKSLDSMQDSVDVVESGLSALGDKAKSAMSKLTSAFDKTASKAKDAGKKVGTGFTTGMQTGLAKAPVVANSTIMVVNASLMAGYSPAYAAGANISRGFAAGMRSQLAVIRSAAAQMAAAADKAVRAKAKIHSPSKVTEGLGSFWGEGFVKGITEMVDDAWRAAQKLVTIPQIKTPELAMAYSGELSPDHSYTSTSEYTIEVPLAVDGKEVARATAKYTQAELDKNQKRDSRKHGKA